MPLGDRCLPQTPSATRVVATAPGKLLRVDVESSSVLTPGERFRYIDIAPGDRVRIAVPRICEQWEG